MKTLIVLFATLALGLSACGGSEQGLTYTTQEPSTSESQTVSSAEQQAIEYAESELGVTLNANEREALLSDGYVCVQQYEALGWSFENIFNDNMFAYGNDAELSAVVLDVAFLYLAAQASQDDYQNWLAQL